MGCLCCAEPFRHGTDFSPKILLTSKMNVSQSLGRTNTHGYVMVDVVPSALGTALIWTQNTLNQKNYFFN